MEPLKSDLLIIGAGPGGYELAAHAAAEGLSVTLIEQGELGGTCLNRGCIPTKALLRSAEVAATVRMAHEYGVKVSDVILDYSEAADRKDKIVSQLREGVAMQLSNVNVIHGEAVMAENRTVKVGSGLYTADNIVIATGSQPIRLPIEGAGLAMTSDELLALEQLPQSIIIVGGGVIGIEFASILNAYGVDVTVLEYCKEILSAFDADLAKRLRQILSRRGIKFVTSATVKAIRPGNEVEYEDKKGNPVIIEASSVLMAVGRGPVFPAGLENAGVEHTLRGITVNDSMETSAKGIYAIGDVNGRCQLAHAASAQGRLVLSRILGNGTAVNLDIIPAAVFTTPELAMVGKTEATAIAPVKVHKAFFRANGKAVAMGESDGLVKILSDEWSERVVGCHILGPHASDLVQAVAVAMNLGCSIHDLKSVIYGHPTLSEVIGAVN